MTTLAQRSALGGRRNGGVAARRAVVRWATRMFRRDWRAAAPSLPRSSSSPSLPRSAASRSPTTRFPPTTATSARRTKCSRFDPSDPQKLQTALDSARESFGTVDVIGHHSVSVPGSVETLDYRSQTPDGTYTGELLALRSGSYPQEPGEVAVTDGAAESLRLEIGSTLALDGQRRTVVGIVENPSKLSDEFALVSPSSASPEVVDLFVDGSEAEHDSFVLVPG